MKRPVMKAVTRELRQARYVAQLEHNLMAYQAANQALADENAQLRELVEYQLQVLANTAKQNAELTKAHAENAVTFLTEKVALLERAETAEAALGLLREARATLEMWQDVAPAVSLCSDIDKALAAYA